MKIQKKKFRGERSGGIRSWGGGGAGEECEPRTEGIVQCTKRGGGCLVGGVRVDVNREVKFLCKFKKKKWGGGVFGLGGVGVRVDVN